MSPLPLISCGCEWCRCQHVPPDLGYGPRMAGTAQLVVWRGTDATFAVWAAAAGDGIDPAAEVLRPPLVVVAWRTRMWCC